MLQFAYFAMRHSAAAQRRRQLLPTPPPNACLVQPNALWRSAKPGGFYAHAVPAQLELAAHDLGICRVKATEADRAPAADRQSRWAEGELTLQPASL